VAYVAGGIFVVAYVLLASEKVHRTKVALGAAGLMLLLHVGDARSIFFSEQTGIDWNVIFLLFGMMIIVSVLRQTGVFEYVAIVSAKATRGRPYPLMVMLALITAFASALLDNVTTILLVAPVTFLVTDRLGLRAAPYLIAEVMASNIGGAATLVGDPPNIIIASRAGLSFNDFLVNMGPIVLILLGVFVVMLRFMFRKDFVYDPERAASLMRLNGREAINDPVLLAQSLFVLALVLAGFVLHPLLHYDPAIVAILGGGALVLFTKVTTEQALAEVEWPTLAFFAGLFIMVGGLVSTGVVDQISQAAIEMTQGRLGTATTLLLGGSAVLSAIIDNIPYVATMSPIVSDLAASHGASGHVLWWALALGADLGGNATAIGASANVVALGIAERAGQRISFWQFTKYGLGSTALLILLSVPYLWLRYLM
jgi:Na+/H+ antiporter NhaD/arsenite permease-like protein